MQRIRKQSMSLEHKEQSKLIGMCRLMADGLLDHHPRLNFAGEIFAIPNGGLRSIREATRLKLEGVTPGVPDLFLPVPVPRISDWYGSDAPWHGFFIEMKRPEGGVISTEQVARLRMYWGMGYNVGVFCTAERALFCVEQYLLHGLALWATSPFGQQVLCREDVGPIRMDAHNV